ncbi:uroporphyrinogen-III synthase [Sphingomonas jaspsi]|uniref:uroporphyrinogen-III synthase n=1 Tax=Sphingomonas jaspsi TaxID=392409 RepID=UPI0004B77196|nr:uroporphyrinogen-III synthase [Sphingomonas jaspsi]
MRTLLLVRPEPGLSASIARARALGLTVVGCPLFEVVPLDWSAPAASQFDGLLLTSANAVRYGNRQLALYRDLPVFAVGAVTADAARAAGFSVQETGEGGVDDLLHALPADLRLLHPGGRHRTAPPGRANITAVAVYEARAIPAPALPPMTDQVVAIHSPRAGKRLAELVTDRGGIDIVAISSAAAIACGGGWRVIAVADQPGDAQLLALAAKLCQTGGR